MTTLELTQDRATISLSYTELYTVNNALNEVCNALDITNFSIRMGVEREEAAKFLEQIHALMTRMEELSPVQ